MREGKAEALMKGSLHTDELMAEVVRRDSGLRTGRRISHCFVMDVPGHADPLIVTDAAINIAPTVEEKVDILQNAIDLAHALAVSGSAGGDSFGYGDSEPESAVDNRSRRAVQDGGPRAGDRGTRRRSARAR